MADEQHPLIPVGLYEVMGVPGPQNDCTWAATILKVILGSSCSSLHACVTCRKHDLMRMLCCSAATYKHLTCRNSMDLNYALIFKKSLSKH